MSSNTREEIVAAFDALKTAVSEVVGLSFDVLTTPERLNLLERLEGEARRLPVSGYALINQIAEQADETELGARLPAALAERLRITRGEATRRVAEAAELGPRRALTGQPLAPLLTATAQAVRTGGIGGAHVQVIRGFLHRMPSGVDVETREKAEAHLARLATQFRPDQVAKLADRLTDCLNPDGNYTDEDRARRRGLTVGKQGPDGMSHLRGWLTPEARATLDAVLAKSAAPRHVQSRGRHAHCGWRGWRGGGPARHPQHRPTQSRRTQRGHAGLARFGGVGSAQRVTGHHHRDHHPQGARIGIWHGDHRWGHPATGERRDPDGPPRTSLSGDLRQRQSPRAVSHETTGLTRSANRAVRKRPWLHPPRLRCARLLE